ncbi:MAG: hypothetical protein LC667_08600 [Thioalkalivibrio sp.]|nr:hypothetical protein [Thioalkalivibrio sp.]
MTMNGRNTLTRARRLQRAKRWLASYRGKNLVRGYTKRFGVDTVCAIVELRMLGVDIPDARLEQARRDERARAAQRARRKEKDAAGTLCDWDGEFAFIAGYTEGGAPYGIRWDELDDEPVRDGPRRPVDPLAQAARLMEDDEDLPF